MEDAYRWGSLSRDRGINQNESHTRSFSRTSRATKTRRRRETRAKRVREMQKQSHQWGYRRDGAFLSSSYKHGSYLPVPPHQEALFPSLLSHYFISHSIAIFFSQVTLLFLARTSLFFFFFFKQRLSHTHSLSLSVVRALFSEAKGRDPERRLVNMIPESDTRKPLITPKHAWMGLGHRGSR